MTNLHRVLLALTLASPLPSLSFAQPAAPPPAGVRVAPGEVLNFKTEGAKPAPDKAQVGKDFKFVDGAGPMAPPVTYDALADDTPYKTYIGYPKNSFSASLQPETFGATWSYNGQDINFRSSTLAVGLAYKLVATPRFGIDVSFNHSMFKIGDAQVSNYRVTGSNTTLDTYFVNGHYCFFGRSSFAIQYCPGVQIGNDAYPVLKFYDNLNLRLDRVQDFVIGLNVRLQTPITDRISAHFTPGFLLGTGIGNSGALTSKNNSTIYGLLGADYELGQHNALGLEFNFDSRNAKIKGKVGNNDDSWTTKATDFGARFAYTYTL